MSSAESLVNTGEKLVFSEFANRLIPMSEPGWRHECEVAFFLGLPEAKREAMLEGSSDGRELGVKQLRGEATVAMLRKEMHRLAEIRRSRTSTARPQPLRERAASRTVPPV